MKKALSNEDYTSKKQEALKTEPVTSQVGLNQIELVDVSFKEKFVKVNGKNVAVADSFFSDLSRMLHISSGLQNELTGGGKRIGDRDEKLYPRMVEALKALKRSDGRGGVVTLVGDPTHGELTGITDKPYSRLPNRSLFDIAERLNDKYPSLDIVDVAHNGGGMSMSVTLMQNEGREVGGLGTDETFKFGFSLNNGGTYGGGTSINDFIWRLICENGAEGIDPGGKFNLKSHTSDGINKLFEHIAEMEKRGFMPGRLEDNIRNARGTNASFAEIEHAYKFVINNLAEEDAEIKEHFKREIAHTYFQGYVRTMARLAGKKVDILQLTDKQKAFVNSGQNMWNLINNITWLGSHATTYKWHSEKKMRMIGGKMISQELDLANTKFLNL